MVKRKKSDFQRKVTRMIILVCFVSVLTGSVFDFFYEYHRLKKEQLMLLEQEARLLSDNCALPLEFNYPETANDILQKLEINPRIRTAVLFDTNKVVFATYKRDSIIVVPGYIEGFKKRIEGNIAEIYFPVSIGEQTYGILYLSSNNNLTELVIEEAISALIVILLILILVILVSQKLKDIITVPVEKSITENELRWRFALEGSGGGVWDWNLETNEVFFSRVWKTMLGYRPEEIQDSINSWEKLIHPDDVEVSNKTVDDYLNGRASSFLLEHRLKTQNGDYKWILSRGKIMDYNDEGKPLRFVGTHTDISLQKENETLMSIAKEKALESERLKSAFLANMSHEIRTPLNGIVGFCGLLNNTSLTLDKVSAYTNIINRSSERLLSIVNDILDFSKIETGQIEIKKTDFQLNELMEEMYCFYLQRASQKDVKLKINKGIADGKDLIFTDKTKLYQILNNLLSNAVKFTSKGDVTFSYKLTNGVFEFIVADTGKGIPERDQTLIFERFRQVETEVTSDNGGTGLGLSIAQKLVELLGGKIWLKSEIGIGSEFCFTIPVSEHKKEEVNNKVKIKDRAISKSKARPKILIVDDEDVNLIFVRESLGANYDLIEANNGVEAINEIQKSPDFDLVLMDIRMPVMNGIEALKKIKENWPEMNVIAQTAYGLKDDKQKLLSEGFDDYISKPIVEVELKNILKKFFNI